MEKLLNDFNQNFGTPNDETRIFFKNFGDIPLDDMDNPEDYLIHSWFKHKCIITLRQGEMFGELGILMKKPRIASALA